MVTIPKAAQPRSDSCAVNPLVDVAPGPSAMAVTQSDVMRAGCLDAAFSLGGPIVKRGNRYAGHSMNLFGGQHFAVSLRGDRHVCSFVFGGVNCSRMSIDDVDLS